MQSDAHDVRFLVKIGGGFLAYQLRDLHPTRFCS